MLSAWFRKRNLVWNLSLPPKPPLCVDKQKYHSKRLCADQDWQRDFQLGKAWMALEGFRSQTSSRSSPVLVKNSILIFLFSMLCCYASLPFILGCSFILPKLGSLIPLRKKGRGGETIIVDDYKHNSWTTKMERRESETHQQRMKERKWGKWG